MDSVVPRASRSTTLPNAETQDRQRARRVSTRPLGSGRAKAGRAAPGKPPAPVEVAPIIAARPLWQRVQEAQQAVTLLRQELESSSRANVDSCRAASPGFFTYTAQLHQELDAARAHLAELKQQQVHDDGSGVPTLDPTGDRGAAPVAEPVPSLAHGEGGPPALPEAWGQADADLGEQVSLRDGPGEPYKGTSPCVCGGTWRYDVAGTEARPIWRCLHCGAVQQGER